MNSGKQQEMNENLEYLRGQFNELNQQIKLPHSLDADMMRYKLENLDLIEAKPKNRRWVKQLAGIAASFVVVFGVFQMTQGSNQSPASQETPAGDMAQAPMAARAAEVPMPQAAAFDLASGADEGAIVQEAAPVQDAVSLTFEQAHAMKKWGSYLPVQAPEGLAFAEAMDLRDHLYIAFLNDDFTKELYVNVWYDAAQTLTPEGEAVFLAEELTEAQIAERLAADAAQEGALPQGVQFSVRYPEDVVVTYIAVGMSPAELYELTTAVPTV